jgi:hypothetical protein
MFYKDGIGMKMPHSLGHKTLSYVIHAWDNKQ